MRSYAKIVKRFYDAKVCQRINGIRKVTQDMAHMERVIMSINGSGKGTFTQDDVSDTCSKIDSKCLF